MLLVTVRVVLVKNCIKNAPKLILGTKTYFSGEGAQPPPPPHPLTPTVPRLLLTEILNTPRMRCVIL